MNKDETRLRILFFRWYHNEITEEEKHELFNLLDGPDDIKNLEGLVKEAWDNASKDSFFSPEQKDQIINEVLGRKVKAGGKTVYGPWWKLSVAAAVLLIFISAYLFFIRRQDKERPLVKTEQPKYNNDIAPPQINKATLTLGNGKVINFDSLNIGSLAGAGAVNAKKISSGELSYESSANEAEYQTLTVPRGSRPMKLILTDGTGVWLNVESSITYPTVFAGNERKVAINGEAYFEVAHDASKPFIVSKGTMNVTVLGTHFDINAYDDEDAIRITLLEGSVKVSAHTTGSSQVIKPGQQAILDHDSQWAIDKSADIDRVMAWKNGRFQFNDANVETIMRQISRWYNVEVTYKARPEIHFGGKIDRNSTLIQMFNILETSGLHFKIEGNKVTVLP